MDMFLPFCNFKSSHSIQLIIDDQSVNQWIDRAYAEVISALALKLFLAYHALLMNIPYRIPMAREPIGEVTLANASILVCLMLACTVIDKTGECQGGCSQRGWVPGCWFDIGCGIRSATL